MKESKESSPLNLEQRKKINKENLTKTNSNVTQTKDDINVHRMMFENFSRPQNSKKQTRFYRGDTEKNVTDSALVGIPPLLNNGENTITTEIQGAAAYASGVDGKQNGAIVTFLVDSEMLKKGLDHSILTNKRDLSRDPNASKNRKQMNIQATTPESIEYLTKAIIPGSVKIIDPKSLIVSFKPTRKQKEQKVTGSEYSLRKSKSVSDLSKFVMSDALDEKLDHFTKEKKKSATSSKIAKQTKNKAKEDKKARREAKLKQRNR